MTGSYKNKKNLLNGGFTLLELIVVIAIMGFLAAMVVPLVGFAGHQRRVEYTKERLELVRTAIIGPVNAFDVQGRRVIGGYVGDRGDLPGLYKSKWNAAGMRWKWVDTEITLATGQPLGLWVRGDQIAGIATGVTACWDGWRGPYLSYPTDLFPDDAEGLFDSDRHNNKNSLDEFHMRQTDGRLSDAWGRALLFWKDNDDTFWIISEGPDRESNWDGTGGAYVETHAANEDNIVIKIPATVWHSPDQPARVWETQKILDDIRTALIGPPGAFDPSGRRIVGGYIGDRGAWPEFYKWDNTIWTTTGVVVTATGVVMQPRALWTVGLSTSEERERGFAWCGPYLPRPWGTGVEEVLRDAWEQPLYFRIATGVTGIDELTATSAGLDGVISIATGTDDIKLTITKDQWIASGMQVKGQVKNIGTVHDINDVKVRLWITSGKYVEIVTGTTITTDSAITFPLPGDTRQHNIPAGLRIIEVATGAVIYNSSTIFIGAGGTQSPVADVFILTVTTP